MLRCIPLDTPGALRRHFALLDEACVRLSAREERDHFAPDVYTVLLRGEARAFLICRDEQDVGLFTVLGGAACNGEPALHVWHAYVRPGAGDDVLPFGLRECERVAREEGFRTLVMSTQRRGWLRKAPELGFELREFRFERQVDA